MKKPLEPEAYDRLVAARVRRQSPKWRVLRDHDGHAEAIAKGKDVVLHLNPGTCRNEACVDAVVALMNGKTCRAAFNNGVLKR